MVRSTGSLSAVRFDAVAATPTLHRLSPDVYDRMVESGMLEGEPVELIDGLLVHVTPQGVQHAALVQWLTRQLGARLDLLRVQLPLATPSGRPEPDIALAQTVTSRDYPRTAALAVEVAVTSLRDDVAKLPGYAEAGVDTVWLVDVPARQVRVFEQPYGRRYERERILGAGDLLDSPVDGVAPVAVAELFAVLDR
jgi:Uma2 family endonuclease